MSAFRVWGSICCLSLIIILVCYAGCSQEASFTPPEDLNTGERFRDTSLVAARSDWSNSGQSAGPARSSQRFVVCNWQGYLSRGFVRFSALPDSTVAVDSAMLYLYITRVDGDAEGVTFDVHSLTDTLDQTNIYWGNMPGISDDPITSFALPSQSGDSLTADVTGIVTSWIKHEISNLGLAIKAKEDMGAPQVIAEFATREVPPKEITDTTMIDFRPALRIAYVDTAGEDQRAVSIASEDVFADTLITPFPPDNLSLLCGNGFPSRAFVKFDLSRIPVGSSVTRSVLVLSPNLEESSFDSMGVICHASLDATWHGFDTRIGASGTGLVTLKPDELAGGEKVEMTVTALIQPMVAGTQPNYGLVIRSPNETFDLDFVRFFSHSYPDIDLVPRLQVEYVVPPAPPFPEDKEP
jgi:hypothetical protein